MSEFGNEQKKQKVVSISVYVHVLKLLKFTFSILFLLCISLKSCHWNFLQFLLFSECLFLIKSIYLI